MSNRHTLCSETLCTAKRSLHGNAHCITSSGDASHCTPSSLQPSCLHEQAAHALLARLPRPRLGCFGVIDERLDMGLVAQLADSRPDWQIVMVGPVVKIDPAPLPQRQNAHWLGMQPCARLPYLLAGWDACLMPFALNESTRFISPSKTLKYMAGEKPVVSTPVKDVIWLYGNVVEVAETRATSSYRRERSCSTSRPKRAADVPAKCWPPCRPYVEAAAPTACTS